jgi:hypothetical protein
VRTFIKYISTKKYIKIHRLKWRVVIRKIASVVEDVVALDPLDLLEEVRVSPVLPDSWGRPDSQGQPEFQGVL